MDITSKSVLWGVALSLFLGGLGFPIPENPLLMGGGYAISQKLTDPAVGLSLWYIAILTGDSILFSLVRWLFTWPLLKGYLLKMVGTQRLDMYQKAFYHHGGWTLFLARFTFGIRSAAYVAAGVAYYPWPRFLLVDGISVAIQLLLFASIGYYAGDRISWAEATARTIALLLTGALVVSIAASWAATRLIRRFTKKVP
ncbi:MAG: VTT domain-containing protein [Deltaproteobacteria bacterium]|nr:VTT domain-containing protein [Deltaproteobacteria bacterium]MBW2125523.1 VTT domain-containing protein [Deltaproteobacteria bacterium]